MRFDVLSRGTPALGLGGFFAVAGALSVWDALRIRETVRRPGLFDVLGPDNYLLGVGLILLPLSALLAASAFRAAPQLEEKAPPPQASRLYLAAFALTALYVLGILIAGYVFVTALYYFLCMLRLLGGQRWSVDIGTSVALTATFYVLFVYLADIPLPQGWLR